MDRHVQGPNATKTINHIAGHTDEHVTMGTQVQRVATELMGTKKMLLWTTK